MEALFVLLIFEIIFLFASYYITDRDFLSPSTILSLVMTFSTGLAVLYYKNWYAIKKFSWEATFIILSGIFIFIICDMFAKRMARRSRKDAVYINKGRNSIQIQEKKILVIIGMDLIILLFFYKYMTRLVEKYDAMNRYGVSSVTAAYRLLYGHDFVVSAGDRINAVLKYFLYFMQASAYVCLYPFIYKTFIENRKIKKTFIYIIPAACFVAYGLLCASRIDILKLFISGFFMFYVLYLKHRGWSRNNLQIIAKKGIKIVFYIFIAFFALSIVVGRSAIGDSIIGSFIMHLAGYAGASIMLFSDFMLNPLRTIIPGEECFTNLYLFLRKFGIANINHTAHLEYRHLTAGITGNVYTFFRSPIADFGVGGMLFFTATVAFFFSIYYYKYIKFARFKNKDRFSKHLIIYSMLFQWLVFASINQMSSEFVSVAFVIKIVMTVIIYEFLFHVKFVSGNVKN